MGHLLKGWGRGLQEQGSLQALSLIQLTGSIGTSKPMMGRGVPGHFTPICPRCVLGHADKCLAPRAGIFQLFNRRANSARFKSGWLGDRICHTCEVRGKTTIAKSWWPSDKAVRVVVVAGLGDPYFEDQVSATQQTSKTPFPLLNSLDENLFSACCLSWGRLATNVGACCDNLRPTEAMIREAQGVA